MYQNKKLESLEVKLCPLILLRISFGAPPRHPVRRGHLRLPQRHGALQAHAGAPERQETARLREGSERRVCEVGLANFPDTRSSGELKESHCGLRRRERETVRGAKLSRPFPFQNG